MLILNFEDLCTDSLARHTVSISLDKEERDRFSKNISYILRYSLEANINEHLVVHWMIVVQGFLMESPEVDI